MVVRVHEVEIVPLRIYTMIPVFFFWPQKQCGRPLSQWYTMPSVILYELHLKAVPIQHQFAKNRIKSLFFSFTFSGISLVKGYLEYLSSWSNTQIQISVPPPKKTTHLCSIQRMFTIRQTNISRVLVLNTKYDTLLKFVTIRIVNTI